MANQSGIVGQLVFRDRGPNFYPEVLGVDANSVWHAYYAEFAVRIAQRWASNQEEYNGWDEPLPS